MKKIVLERERERERERKRERDKRNALKTDQTSKNGPPPEKRARSDKSCRGRFNYTKFLSEPLKPSTSSII